MAESMSLCRKSALIIALVGAIVAAEAMADEGGESVLTVRVTQAGGEPAAGAPLKVVGLLRQNLATVDAGRTGDEGELEIRFMAKRDHEDRERPGYGAWRVVALPEDHAPAISDVLLWADPEPRPHTEDSLRERLENRIASATEDWASGSRYSVWANTEVLTLRAGESLDQPMRLAAGESIAITVQDELGRPIVGREIKLNLCLESETRHGMGLSVELAECVTDDHGQVMFDHIGDLVYAFEMPGGGKYTSRQTHYRATWLRHHILEQGPVIEYEVDKGRSINLQTIDAETGEPLPVVQIRPVVTFRALVNQPISALWTDERGRLHVENHPSRSVLWLQFARNGYEQKSVSLDDIPKDAVLTVALTPSAEEEFQDYTFDPPDEFPGSPRVIEIFGTMVEGELIIREP